VEVINTDLAVIGGGTAGSIAAYEAKKAGLDVVILEKAGIKRSGCLAPGVNAIYSYLHEGDSPEDYVKWVEFQGMGLLRRDLAHSMISESRYAVSILENYGLITDGERQGRFGLRIAGESIKPILADIARENAEIIEHCYAFRLAADGSGGSVNSSVKGVYAYDIKNDEVFFVRARATLIATGGCSGIYKPYTVPWYPPCNAGTGYALAIRAGAEITSFEIRFIPIRIKDVNSPIGVTAVGFRAPLRNADGEEFMKTKYAEFGGETAPIAIRAYGPMKEIMEGKFPVYIDTRGLTQEQVEILIKLYLNGWPIFLLFLKARQIDPSEEPLEVQPCEPYITGSHTVAGIWVDEGRMTSVPNLLAAGDAAGGVPLKHVGGALAEGVIAARTAATLKNSADFRPEEPEFTFDGEYEASDVEKRMQYVLDCYAGGMSRFYYYNEQSVRKAILEIEKLRSVSLKGKPLRCFEVTDRLEVARVMLYHMLERRETRMPPFQMRSDYPEFSDSKYFLNSVTVNGAIKLIRRDAA
jgi:adenylylsulfate reductase subunit A